MRRYKSRRVSPRNSLISKLGYRLIKFLENVKPRMLILPLNAGQHGTLLPLSAQLRNLCKIHIKTPSEPPRRFGTNAVAERSLKPHRVAAASVADNGGQLINIWGVERC
jgi:hypothetical protein